MKKTRFSVTLTEPYAQRLGELVERGLYMDAQAAIREALRNLFEKHGISLEPNRPGQI